MTIIWALAMTIAGAPPPAPGQANLQVKPALRFDQFKPDLVAYAHEVEKRCDFHSGAALKVYDQHSVSIELADPQGTPYTQFMCLMNNLNAKDLRRNGIKVVILGKALE